MEVYNRKYDLNEEQDFKDFCFFSQTARDLTKENFLQDKCSINAYLKENKKSYLSCGEYYLYNQFNNFIIVKEKKIVFKKLTNKIVEYGLLKKNLEGATSAIIIDCETRLGETKDMKHMLLLNADEDNLENNYASLVNELGHQGHPCASFACIAKMFNCDTEIAVNRIINGRFKLIDYTNNEIILFTKAELKKIKKQDERLDPPKLGFTQMSNHWHRAGTCLFVDKKTNKFYIFGQDEGSYFGCELPKAAQNVEEAFKVLIPDEIVGKSYRRQGEWFIVAVPNSEVPEPKDCILQFDDDGTWHGERVYLPLDSPESNKHTINVDDGRVSKNGKVYVRSGYLYHEQHCELEFAKNKWYTFYKNTAVKSVSQEGVD